MGYKPIILLLAEEIWRCERVNMKAPKIAFLKYIGNRKWRKIREANISIGKSFLIYLGSRKWKRKRN